MDFCGEIDYELVPLLSVLSQVNRTLAGKAAIVTKGDSAPLLNCSGWPEGIPVGQHPQRNRGK
jgi:hypothetical protein